MHPAPSPRRWRPCPCRTPCSALWVKCVRPSFIFGDLRVRILRPVPPGDPRRLQEEEDRLAFPPRFHVLLPPACSPNEKPTVEKFRQLRPHAVPAGTGRHSQSVRMRLGLSCAGWKPWPTSEEFYEAVRAPRPTPRQRLIWRRGPPRRTGSSWSMRGRNRAYTLRRRSDQED